MTPGNAPLTPHLRDADETISPSRGPLLSVPVDARYAAREPHAQPVVLHVLEAIAGGTSRHVIDLVQHTPGVRHIVAAPRRRVGAVPDAAAISELREAGATVHLVEMRRSPLHPRNLAAFVTLAKLARRYEPDVIHGHSAIGGALARAIPAPNQPLRLYTPNGLNQSRFAMLMERLLVRRTDHVVAVSPSEARLLSRVHVASGEALVTIPNGIVVDPDPTVPVVDLRELAGIPAGAPLVGTVARLLPQKAPERFVECCRQVALRHPDTYFLLVGDGPQAAEVDALADCPELRGRFVRLREVQHVAPSLTQLDVFVLLSRFEGGPYAPLEAMLGGTPIVLSDGVGNVDVLRGDFRLEQFIVPAGDPTLAADRVSDLLADELLRRRTGSACISRVLEHFDVAEMGLRYAELYGAALADVTPHPVELHVVPSLATSR